MAGFGTAIDCVGHPDPAAVKAAGHRAVALYVGTPGRAKSPTRAQVAAYLAAGLDLILVYEDGATSWDTGRAQGRLDALAVDGHLRSLGLDLSQVGVVYHAIDTDAPADELGTVRDYLTGAGSVYGPEHVGVYGSRTVVAAALDAGVAALGWASAGWQYGHIDPRCVLEQQVLPTKVGGVDVDVDVVLADDFGQYPHPTAPPPAVPVPHTSEEAVTLIELPATPLPADPPGGRWQDTAPSSWPMAAEQRTALVPAVAGGWRGLGSISSITCGWAGNQDPPSASGVVKPSGWIQYARIFGFTDISYKDWQVKEVLTNVALVGNRSLPQIALPPFCTFLVIRYAAPGGLYLAFEYEH